MKHAELLERYEELLAAFGLHPDTDQVTVLAHIESVRREARESADAYSRGREAGLAAHQPAPRPVTDEAREAKITAWRAKADAESANLEDWDGAGIGTDLLDEAVALMRSAPPAPSREGGAP